MCGDAFVFVGFASSLGFCVYPCLWEFMKVSLNVETEVTFISC